MDIQEVNMVDANPNDPIENNNSPERSEVVVVSVGVRFLPTDYKLITTYLNRRQEGLHKLLPDHRIRDVDDVFSYSPSILFEKYRLNKQESWYFLSKLKEGYKRSRVATGDGEGYWYKGIKIENVYDPNTNANANTLRGGLSLNPNAIVNANANANRGGLNANANANVIANANANAANAIPKVNVNSSTDSRSIVGYMRNLYFYSRRGDAASAIKTTWVMRIYTSTGTNLLAAPSTSAGPVRVGEANEKELGDVALCKIYNSEHLY